MLERSAAGGVSVDALHPLLLDPILTAALREDLGSGDLTSQLVLGESDRAVGNVTLREPGVIAGAGVLARVFYLADPAIATEVLVPEGALAEAGAVVARVSGPARGMLMAERVALNLLQRMCAVATTSHRFVERLAGSKTRLLDTRKTTPGLRILERYAVRTGGGRNHRFGLSDAVMIKDNHIALAGSIAEAVRRARLGIPVTAKVLVEADTLFQVQEALAAGADHILLDNMTNEEIEQAVALVAGRIPVEASGGITLERAGAIARTGVDYLSTSAITRLAGFLDISLDMESSR